MRPADSASVQTSAERRLCLSTYEDPEHLFGTIENEAAENLAKHKGLTLGGCRNRFGGNSTSCTGMGMAQQMCGVVRTVELVRHLELVHCN
jgi:hypothetical protein